MKNSSTLSNFLKLALPYKWSYIGLFVMGILFISLDLLFAQTSRELFDLAPHIPRNSAQRILITFAVIIATQFILRYLNEWLGYYLNESVVYSMRKHVLVKIQHLPLKYFDENHSSKVNNVFFNQLETTKDFVVSSVQDIIKLPLTFILTGLFLFQVHYLLGIIALLASVLQVVSTRAFKKRLENSLRREAEVDEEIFYTVGETVQGIREIKTNQLEIYMDERLENCRNKGIVNTIRRVKLQTLRDIIKDTPAKIGYILGVGAGIYLMTAGEIGPGDLIAFITLIGKMVEPFNGIVDIYSSFQETMAKAKDLFEVMAEPTENYTEGKSIGDKIESLKFNNVFFAYSGSASDVLSNVCLEIKGGSTIALVGPSGGGKSTLVKLLYRFYEPQRGCISINDAVLCEYSIDSIRRNMSIVSQDIFIFDGNIFDNIVMGRKDITHNDVEEALNVSQAREFIERLPEGLNTKVGERGVKLSQGQKQRIAIARAVIKKSMILILDEPTASLDVDTEAAFQTALDSLDGERIKIIIAHRLTTIKNADYIVFLDNGKIAEQGTQDKLISLNGRFKDYRDKSMI